MSTKTQNEMVIRHLRKIGPLTPLTALREYGIARLAARVHELNYHPSLPHKGIHKKMVSVFTRNGRTRVAQYSL